jgi:acetyl-CoA acetyltransferase
METVTLTADECTRPGTTAEGLASLRPVINGGVLTAGNASRRSDLAAACVVVDATEDATYVSSSDRGTVAARNTCENVRRWRHGCARLFEVL